MRWILALVVWLWPMAVLAQAVPEALAKRIGADPAGYLEDVAELIAGYGAGGAIGREELETVVLLARATARASALRRLQGADLDGDGAVTSGELGLVAAASSAAQRGRLAGYFVLADGDDDGTVSAPELSGYAGAAGLAAYDEGKAARLRAVMAFDADGDGRVTLAEAGAGVAALAAAAPSPAGSKGRDGSMAKAL